MPLLYDTENHLYAWKGRIKTTPMPSVTQILKIAGVTDHSFVPQDALQRGTDVHSEIAAMLDGDEYRDGGEPDINEYVYTAQARKFLLDTGAGPVDWEKAVCHRGMPWYAGTLDLVARIGGVTYLLDWKVNTVYEGVGLQLAAYAAAYNSKCHNKNRIRRIAAVCLKEDRYQLHDMTEQWPAHWCAFQQARATYQAYLDAQKECIHV